MSILGIDYGHKKIGLAKSSGSLAVPFGVIHNHGLDPVIQEIASIAEEENIEEIVVGIPKGLGGEGGTDEKKVLKFVEKLKKVFLSPIHLEDERLSTKMAQNLGRAVQKSGQDDAVSAMLILQSFLDKKNQKS